MSRLGPASANIHSGIAKNRSSTHKTSPDAVNIHPDRFKIDFV